MAQSGGLEGNYSNLLGLFNFRLMPTRCWTANIGRSTTRMIVCSYPALHPLSMVRESGVDTLGKAAETRQCSNASTKEVHLCRAVVLHVFHTQCSSCHSPEELLLRLLKATFFCSTFHFCMLDPNNFLSSVSLRHPGILLDYPISDLISLYCIILSQTQPDSHLALSKIEWLWLQRADIDEKHKTYFETRQKEHIFCSPAPYRTSRAFPYDSGPLQYFRLLRSFLPMRPSPGGSIICNSTCEGPSTLR
jgi:hypothetical protein